jgi:gamma-glutamyltranspeptidase/glutathione hydrolase
VLLQLLARAWAGDADAGQTIAAPRWVLSGAEPGYDVWQDRGRVRVAIEPHAPDAWFDGLAARGHDVTRLRPFSAEAGHAHVIRIDHERGTLAGAADPRAYGGAAAGW